jgi:hypothetical protein
VGISLGAVTPLPLAPDHEVKALTATTRRIRAMRSCCTCLSVLRWPSAQRLKDIMDVAPQDFIVVASIAIAFWAACCASPIGIRGGIVALTPGRWARGAGTWV